MAIANCARCSRLFQKMPGVKICPDCVMAEEEAFRVVRDFLELNPGADIGTVSAGTGIEEPVILRLVQNGRLASMAELAAGLRIECRNCTKPVVSGRYCPECTEEMAQSLKQSAQALQPRNGADPGQNGYRSRRPETLEEKRRFNSSSPPDRR